MDKFDITKLKGEFIGGMIRRCRKEKGLTQEQLAQAAGISTMSVRRYESGERVVTDEVLKKISVALDVEISEFFPDTYIDALNQNSEDEYWNGVRDRLRAGLTTGAEEEAKLKKDVMSAIRKDWRKEIDDFVNSDEGLNIIVHCIWMNKKGQAEALKLVSELGERPEFSLEKFYNDEIRRMEKIIAVAERMLSEHKKHSTSDFSNSEGKDTNNAKKPPEGEKTTSDGEQ